MYGQMTTDKEYFKTNQAKNFTPHCSSLNAVAEQNV